MAIALRKRLETTTSLGSLIGKLGDPVVDITKKTLVIMDGTTPGGVPLSREDHTHANATDSAAGFESAADHVFLYNHRHANATTLIDGFLSATDKARLDALSSMSGGTPSATGNVPNTVVLRDSAGSFAAQFITAIKFIGPLQGNADTVTNGVVTTGSYANPSWITSLDAAKLTGTIPGSVSFAGTIPWTSVTGKPTVVSFFTNDSGYITSSANITGTAAGVQSTGGRETASPTAGTVILRDGAGRAQVATPSAAGDIATKGYVDANSGGFSYYPITGIFNQQFLTNGTNAPFTLPICSLTENGFLKTITIFYQGLSSPGSTVGSNVFLGITVDGKPEFQELLLILSQNYFGFPYNEDTQKNRLFYNTPILTMDIPYKVSLAVRLFSTSPFSLSIFGAATVGAQVNRYARAL